MSSTIFKDYPDTSTPIVASWLNDVNALVYSGVIQPGLLTVLDNRYGASNSAVWGNITGTLSAQVDLQTALNQKMTNPMIAKGDLIVGSTSGAPVRLSATNDGYVLTLSGGTPVWAAGGSSGTATYSQLGAGAIVRPDQDKLRQFPDVTDYGADASGALDSATAFSNAGASNSQVLVPAGTFKLNSTPSSGVAETWIFQDGAHLSGAGVMPANAGVVKYGRYTGSWVSTVNGGVFDYIPGNGTLNVVCGGYNTLGLTASSRTSTGPGTAGSASIAVSAFINNDSLGAFPSGYGYYVTAVRQAGVGGATHGMEMDVCNFGSTVQLTPANMFLAGQNDGFWLCTGGEAATAGRAGVVSAALCIVQNDSSVGKTAKFDKGIIFHNRAISGADGTGGSNLGCAVAFAAGHQQIWFNNSNQAVAEITASGINAGAAVRLDLNANGLVVQDRASGAVGFSVSPVSGGLSYLTAQGGSSVTSPSLQANGALSNIDLRLTPKGSGSVVFDYTSYAATNPAAFSPTRILAIKDGAGNTYYLPVANVVW